MARRSPYSFFNYFCKGGLDENGYYQADGKDPRADTELVERLATFMIKRPRSVIWKDVPEKTRQVIRMDCGGADNAKALLKAKSEKKLYAALEKTLVLKLPEICDNVIEGLGAGEKSVVWCLTRKSVEMTAQALEKATEKNTVRTLMREQNVAIWATHGDADIKSRHNLAQTFREHKGAGVIIATMDSMPEAISLFGATVEHYAQMHYLPGPMAQTENRPYLRGSTKLHIIYYVAVGTIDEHLERLVLPRAEAMATITGDQDAMALGAAMTAGEKEEESLDDFFARLSAGTSGDDFDPDHSGGLFGSNVSESSDDEDTEDEDD